MNFFNPVGMFPGNSLLRASSRGISLVPSWGTPWGTTLFQCASPDRWAVWGVVVSTRWWLLVDQCVLRNWDRILVRAVKGLISRGGMISTCPLLWQRGINKPNPVSVHLVPQWDWGMIVLGIVQRRDNHLNCCRHWCACVTIAMVTVVVEGQCRSGDRVVHIPSQFPGVNPGGGQIPVWVTIPGKLGKLDDELPFGSGRANGLRNPEGGYPWISSGSSSN